MRAKIELSVCIDINTHTKMVKTAFIRQSQTVLDNMPMHVIKYHIFPYLDYNSRVNLNQCLPICDRHAKKMPAISVLKHDLDIRIKVIQGMLDKITAEAWDSETSTYRTLLRGDARMIEMTKFFKTFQQPYYFNIISLFPIFNIALLEKIQEFETIPEPGTLSYSKARLDNFTLEVNKLKKKIETEKPFFTNTAPPLSTIKPLIFV
jgi:hypothetical protein